ncbi:hypothetical protein GUITHDRAFT_74910, partial [Guillardia theta CCMP2712]
LQIFHNWSFDGHLLANHGIEILGHRSGDTVHMARLWDTSRQGRGGYKLSSLMQDLLGWGKTDMKEVFGRFKLKKDGTPGKVVYLPDSLTLQTDPNVTMFEKWIHYSTYDTICTWYLYFSLRKELENMSWSPDAIVYENELLKMRADRTLFTFYDCFWRPFGQILTDMERKGMYIDKDYLYQQAEKAQEDKEKRTESFMQWVRSLCPDGKYININSNPQKRHLLFSSITEPDDAGSREPHMRTFQVDNKVEEEEEREEEEGEEGEVLFLSPPRSKRSISLLGLALTPVAYTATGQASTAGQVIQKLAGKPFASPPSYGTAFKDLGGGEEGKAACEALASLLEGEAIEKLLSTFLLPLPEQTDEASRIHTSLNINTETGRLSSQRPNLQNQPALEKDVYRMRKAFSAPPGRKLIIVDYGQLELRIMAQMTGCRSMLDAFEQGGDFHSRTAIDMYRYIAEAVERKEVLLEWNSHDGAPPAPMLKDKFASERRKAKTLNFGIAYGMTKMKVARDWGVSLEEAEETIQTWYSARKEVKQWQEEVIERARRTGYTETFLGRRRYLPEINGRDGVGRGHAERAAINTPIQGGAADIVMMAMLKLRGEERIRRLGWRMVMQIHDEIILEGPEETAEEVFPLVRACMEQPFDSPLSVELPVDGSIADNWYEGK